MKIAVCGEYYSSNLGDPVIVDSMVYMVKNIYPNAEVVIIDLDARNQINKIAEVSVGRDMKKIKIRKPMLLKSAKISIKWVLKDRVRINNYFKYNLKGTDLLIVAGGQMIMNNNLIFPLRLNLLIKNAEEYNIPVIFNSCGVQNYNRSNYGTYLLNKTINNKAVKIITTRDDLDMLNKYINGSDKIVDKNVDVAVWCNKAYNIKKKSDSEVLGLGVIHPIMYEKYYERTKDETYYITSEELLKFWIELISLLDKQHIKWKIFCNGSEEDYQFGLKILKNMNYSDEEIKSKILDKPVKAKQLVNQISGFKTIISHRLHSHIISFSLGIPIIGLIWDKKTLDFAEMIGIENQFFNIKKINPQILYDNYIQIQNSEFVDKSDQYRLKAKTYIEKMKNYINYKK